MAFFQKSVLKSYLKKLDQSIIDQAEKTIKGYQREIEEIKAKLKLLREAVAEQSN